MKNNISENLRSLRGRRGLSQEEVSERIGVSRQAVAKWERGETTPDIVNCAALAKLYDVTLDDLVNYSPASDGGLGIPPKGRHMFGTVTVGDKGQIVIPVKARKIFDIKPGDDLVVLGDEEQGLALAKAQVLLDIIERMREGSEK